MMFRVIAAAAVLGACSGDNPRPAGANDAGAPDAPGIPIDAPSDSSVTYAGMLEQTTPVAYGGSAGTVVFCSYEITLQQLAIELGITPQGRISRGHVQAINVETAADCPFAVIPANLAQYTFRSSRASADGLTLLFAGAPGNDPSADLQVDLTALDSMPVATLSFARNDAGPPLDWKVVATVTLAPP